MKKIIILAAAACTLALGSGALTSCDSDHPERYPEKYRSVVKFKVEGQQDLQLYSTEATQNYTVNVLKGGWEPEAVANVTVGVMSEAEFDSYTKDYGFTYYSRVPSDCYYFGNPGTQNVTFEFGDEDFKLHDVTIIPEKVNDFLLTLPYTQTAVIPLEVKADGASVSETGRYLFLVPNYNEPKLAFATAGMDAEVLSPTDAAKAITVPVKVTLPVENKWNLQYTVAIDTEGLEAYNAAHRTSYALMDPSIYSGITGPEQTFTFPAGATEQTIEITIDGNKLPYTPVCLPLKITSLSGVNIDIDPAKSTLYLGYEVSLVSSYSTNDQEPSEGIIDNLFDGNTGTFFHSTWSAAATSESHDPVYGSYIQFNLASPISGLSFDFTTRANGNGGAPDEVHIYVSNDGQNWTLLEKVTDMLSQLTGGAVKGHWGPYKAAETFQYVRWCVIKSKAGALNEVNSAYWNGSELQLSAAN
ncbi:MAG: DUF1735 domain-containing protein [Pseudoflavonifractor sp.]|nr:DUF1735 domain-containing protein [Alloprevotella sp.]MCM1116972.1 DUF1735 domain-containing protein [Pseudoflavonifractor sp.]